MPAADPPATLSVIIPVYNEEATIATVLRRVRESTPHISKQIIVVDDGSTDGTRGVLERERAIADVVHLAERNRGKGAAIRKGLEFVAGRFAIVQDADLELDPNDYAPVLEPLLSGQASVVYGSRFLSRNRREMPLSVTGGNWFLTWLTNLLFGSRLTDMETAYKAFRSEILCGLELRCERFEFEPEVTAKVLMAGHRIVEVPISYNPRTTAEGKKIRWRDGWTAVRTLLRCWRERRNARG